MHAHNTAATFAVKTPPQPRAVYYYWDRVHVLTTEPPTPQQLRTLKSLEVFQFGRVLGQVHVEDFRWSYGRARYRHRIEICQPSEAALQCLARLPNSARVTYSEPARDAIMANADELEREIDFYLSHFLQLRHGNKVMEAYRPSKKKSGARWIHDDTQFAFTGFTTRKTPERGKRRTGYWLQGYIDQRCRWTGEDFCFHFEGKHAGRQVVERLMIGHPRELLNFDFAAYFAKLKFYQYEAEQFGRHDANLRSGGRRRRPVVRGGYNVDRRRGETVYHALSVHDEENPDPEGLVTRSLQRFIDQWQRLAKRWYGRGNRAAFLTPINPPPSPLHYYVHGTERITRQKTSAAQSLLSFPNSSNHPTQLKPLEDRSSPPNKPL